MALLERLTAVCSVCRRPVLPRVHPSRRDCVCLSCQVHPGHWGDDLGLSLPEIVRRQPTRLKNNACLGDLVLAAITGRGMGTRAWLGAMLGDSLGGSADDQYPIALILADLEQLGHIEQSSDRRRWWLRPSRWIRDRAHQWKGQHMEIAIGARDYLLWQGNDDLMRFSQPQVDRPPLVARVGAVAEDWTLSLARDLVPLSHWISNTDEIDLPEDGRPVKRLTAQGRRADERPHETDVATWQSNGRSVYAVPSANGRRGVARGVARIVASNGLPYSRQGHRFAIPRDFQPPMPYRRVLTLCSGLLPAMTTDSCGNNWLVFDGVADDIFDAIRANLPLREIK